jgi:peptide/nickel transport system permease protein
MFLPVSAILLSILFQVVYAWRTYFLLYANEDYVDLARAKGLTDRMVEQRYVLRPTLPYILTSFALLLVGFWQSTAALEYVFGWPGIGKLYVESLPFMYVTPEGILATDPGDLIVTIGLVVVFAYLMGVTIFLLDILYAIVDPRVRLGGGGETVRGGVVGSGGGVSLYRTRKKFLHVPGSINDLEAIRTEVTITWKFALYHIDWATLKVLFPKIAHRLLQAFRNIPAATRKASAGFSRWLRTLPGTFRSMKSIAHEIIRIPAAVFGLFVILVLVGGSIAAVSIFPYSQLGRLWYVPEISDKVTVPDYAEPVWVNWFRKDKLPPMIFMDSRDVTVSKVFQPGSSGNIEDITITFTLDYPYGGFPRDLLLYFDSEYEQKKPFAFVTLVTPDGREFLIGRFAVMPGTQYSLEEDITKQDLTQIQADKGIASVGAEETVASILFADLSSEEPAAMQGTYQVRIDGLFFEEGNDMDVELVVVGQVYGAAGTDYMRRDLLIPLLWGMPFALAYGLLGALATTILSMILAAMGVWFGGWVDRLIQWLIEMTMILPVVAIAVIVYIFIGVNIWVLLTVVVLLNVFGTPAKSFRAAFLQVKNLPYIESAQT